MEGLEMSAEIQEPLESVHQLKTSLVQIGKEFLETRDCFIKDLPQSIFNSDERQIFIENFKQVTASDIHEQVMPLNLVVVGANSSGKSSFIQHFLDIGDILPSGAGPVTARIVKMTYAPPSQARALIYPSFSAYIDGAKPTNEINLSQYFVGSEPAWEQIREILNQYVNRAAITDVKFEEWAKSFVQIQLPSSKLKLNIDVYDTPGFLSREREQGIMDNLFALVKLIRPTLLFLYENPSVEEMDMLSFIAMKKAIANLDRTPTFFLSTKADVSLIIKNNRKNSNSVTLDSFKDLHKRTRTHRYELLRKQTVMANELLGGLPEHVEQCTCFDICSVPKARTPWRAMTDYMNVQTFHRLISFATEAQASFAHELADHFLRSIENFFDWTLANAYCDEKYFEKLRDEAIEWGNQFFPQFEMSIPRTIEQLHKTIILLIEKKRSSIIDRAACLDRGDDPVKLLLPGSSKRVRDFVDVAVQEEVMKEAVNQTIIETRSSMQSMIENYLKDQKKRKNVLLRMAQREHFADISADTLTKKRLSTKIIETVYNIPTDIWRLIRGLCHLPWTKYYNESSEISSTGKEIVFEIFDSLDAYSALSNEEKRIQYASQYLDALSMNIQKSTGDLDTNFKNLLQQQRTAFAHFVNSTFKNITGNLEAHCQIDTVNMRYYDQFARLQCRILAAKHLYEFKNIRPTIILQEPLGKGGYFTVHPIQWGDKNNLVVKKLIHQISDHPNMAYLDAHYQYMVSLLPVTKVVPLKYLYENKVENCECELWIVLPKFSRSLRDYLVENIHMITFSEVLKFGIDIAETLVQLHENEIVHRDIKASNILLDESKQCYLSDFGTAKRRTTNYTIVGTRPLPPEMTSSGINDHLLYFSYDGMAADIYSFGILLYEMYPKRKYERVHPLSYENMKELLGHVEIDRKITFLKIAEVILMCINPEPKSRPSAKNVLGRLRQMKNTENIEPSIKEKECIICFKNSRQIRFKPCGHKIICNDCFNQVKSLNQVPQCVYCRSTISKLENDAENHLTYFIPSDII